MEQRNDPSRERSQGRPSQHGPRGHACPECGTPREADNTPSCACGSRASDALRDARTAQAAAAEDFDPLRIRPYVELDRVGEPAPPGASPAPSAGPPAGADPASTAPASAPAAHGSAPAAHGSASAAPSDPDATMTLRAVGTEPPAGPPTEPLPAATPEATSTLPTPLAPSAAAPRAHDLRLFETSATAPDAPEGPVGSGAGGTGGRPPRGRRRGVLLSAAAAVVAVVCAAGYASGLFSYETPSRDGALPQEVRAGVPEPSVSEPSATPKPSTPSAPETSASASPSATASASASPSPSPSPSASSASPTPSPSAEPTRTATATPSGDPGQESEDDGRDDDLGGGPALHRGDRGPDVAELQQRLAQLYLYTGDINGNYNHQVEDSVRTYQWARGIRTDDLGVYGPDTRRMLEAETRQP
ncbi:peptidoglycan-binding protein [Streptomyces sp. BK79]|uniref:peptidoglycan-binding domain-containing protein n=1 Tax=Streptomyces sp. BK79 TaxID=3350097 RepID=UPI00376FD2A4